jgi:hypothetical protein
MQNVRGNGMRKDGTRISDEYAAGVIDTRARIHLNQGYNAVITLHLPQEEIAEALIGYFGGGMLSFYTPPNNTSKRFHDVTLSGYRVPEALNRVRPYLISDIASVAAQVVGRASGRVEEVAVNE